MTDIVERLRGKVPMAWEDEGFMSADEDAILATFKEAANEIERLRAALRNVSKSKCEICCQYGRLHDIARAALGEKE